MKFTPFFQKRSTKTKRAIVVWPALLLGGAACGDGHTEPPATSVEVVLPKTELTSIADSISIEAKVGGAAAAGVRVNVVSETRDISNLAVVSTSGLSRSWIVPTGPGTAVLRVEADGAEATSVTIRVTLNRPTVLSSTSTARGNGSDTATITGLNLEQLGAAAVRINGAPVQLLSRTSTNARFVIPVQQPGVSCTGVAPSALLTLDGGDVASSVVVRQARSNELRMAVGEWRPIESSELDCIRLPAAKGAYVMAFVDTREIERATTGFPGIVDPEDFTVTVSDLSRATSAVSSSAHIQRSIRTSVLVESPDVQAASAARQEPECNDEDFTSIFRSYWCRSKPWKVGDRFRLRRPGNGADTVMATVYRIHGNHFVFASIDGDNSARLQHMKAMFDESWPLLEQHAFPLLRSTFGARYPTTSTGSGQLLTIVGDFVHGSVGGGCCSGGDVSSMVFLGSTLDGSLSSIFYLLAHEYAHTWQRRWYHDTRPAAASPISAGREWGSEGGADLLALEAGRRMLGAPWRANVPMPALQQERFTTPWYMEAAAGGVISAGYVHASAFLRDLVARLVVQGVPLDLAFGEVARGSYEDWFGFDDQDVPRLGFTARVRALWGNDWEPRRALLLYALSQGADELTTNPDLQNPFYAGMWSSPNGPGIGGNTVIADNGSPGISFTRRGTSVGYVRIEDSGRGSTLRIATDKQGIVWAIARVR